MNNTFSIKRFLNLCKYSYLLNRQTFFISIGGLIGAIFMLLLFIHLLNNRFYRNWYFRDYFQIFIFIYIGAGVLYSSFAFPGFRTKEKTINYLMFPSSNLEKFTYEFLTRIVLFVVLVPFAYWLAANMEGIIMHSLIPEFINYKFSFDPEKINQFFFGRSDIYWEKALAVSIGCLIFTIPFVGAAYFNKRPLLKTLLSAFAITLFFITLGTSLNYLLDLDHYNLLPSDRMKYLPEQTILKIFFFLTIFFHLLLLVVSYLRIKEKEV